MKALDIFYLRKLGLSNSQIRKIIDYEKGRGEEVLRNRLVVSGCKEPFDRLQKAKKLDPQALRAEFHSFPSFVVDDSVYPASLKEIYDPPLLLFYQGNLDLLQLPALAVVGSRMASPYGIQAVSKIITELQGKLAIVSGLARGIDTAAHKAALRAATPTIGILGTGLGRVYPLENKRLQEYMGHHQLLLSEYGPQETAKPYHFPNRNRIIAGLSVAVLVAEAKVRSGSLITADRALESGREIYAIPGSMLLESHEGCHQLLKEGARYVSCGLDILNDLNVT